MKQTRSVLRDAAVLILPATGMACDEERQLIEHVGARYAITRIESGADGNQPRLLIPGRSQYYEGFRSIRALIG